MTVHRGKQSGLLRGHNVVCFSTADWDTLLPTNKHHLMRRLARRGNRVLYIETLGTRAPRLSSGADATRIARRLYRGFKGPRRRGKRLYTVSPVVRPAWNNGAAIAMNKAAFKSQLSSALRHFPEPIAWVYSPYACHVVDMLKPKAVVFHLVDDLSAVPGADREAIREAEARMLARADVVFCTERSLYDRARRVTQSAWFMPNVADYRHFAHPGEGLGDTRLARVRALPRPRIVFSGNLTPHKVDLELLDKIAEERGDWQFVLIGPEWEGAAPPLALRSLKRRDNVHLTGHIRYESLPPYLDAADVLVIPYRQNDATRAVFPLKFFEYLATGRPVVSSPLPSLLPYRRAVRFADSPEEWIKEIEAALEDTHELEIQRRALARRHTWEKRLDEMAGKIEEVLGNH